MTSSSILTIVGDPNQAIFGWRGGDPSLFSRAEQLYPHMQRYHLQQTFRCPDRIVETANHLLQQNIDSDIHPIHSKSQGGVVSIHRSDSLEEELQQTTARIQSWLAAQIPPSSIAVLARSTDLVQQSILHFHQQGLPVRGENPLGSKAGVQMLALLQFLLDGSALEQAINIGQRRMRSSTYRQLQQTSPAQFELEKQIRLMLSENTEHFAPLQRFITSIDQFHQSKAPLYASLSQLFESLSLPNQHSDIPALDLLLATKTIVLSLSKRAVNLSQLISELKELEQHPIRNPQTILVTTLHKSKGLEFDYVCILGNQNNIFPHYGLTKNDPDALAEERRLLYVGMTRTKKELHLSNHAGTANTEMSFRDGFLYEIADSIQ